MLKIQVAILLVLFKILATGCSESQDISDVKGELSLENVEFISQQTLVEVLQARSSFTRVKNFFGQYPLSYFSLLVCIEGETTESYVSDDVDDLPGLFFTFSNCELYRVEWSEDVVRNGELGFFRNNDKDVFKVTYDEFSEIYEGDELTRLNGTVLVKTNDQDRLINTTALKTIDIMSGEVLSEFEATLSYVEFELATTQWKGRAFLKDQGWYELNYDGENTISDGVSKLYFDFANIDNDLIQVSFDLHSDGVFESIWYLDVNEI